MKNTIISAFAGILLSAAASAAPFKSSTIPLGGMKINPRETQALQLTKLVDGGFYHVVCTLEDASNVVMAISNSNSNSDIEVGDNTLGRGQIQFRALSDKVYIQFHGVSKYDTVKFTNLDLDDSVVLSNCTAMAEYDNANKK